MKSSQFDRASATQHLYEAIQAAQALADRLELATVGIRLDGALVELERCRADDASVAG